MKDCFEMSPTCVTGFYPKPLRDFHMNMGLPPPNINWQYPQMYQFFLMFALFHDCIGFLKLHQNEPGEAKSPSDRRDSGIHSSSEGPVSSPSSDESERYPNHQSPQSPYSYPHNYRIHNAVNSPRSSLPDLPNLMNDDTDNDETGESPSPRLDSSNDTSALKSLEMSVEKNLNISSSESFEKDRISENNNDEYGNHEDYSVPSVNSHGKIKVVKCKQCQLVFNTKLEFWTHQREHIKPDRLLQCEKCPFVTEYKHHLEYHMRNHGGEKPFQCQSCDYKCVNKSMLNSHMKSHSNIYQYRCASCQYSSKYCHSLKLHLRKYNHQPAMVLNPDGTPNPLPIIDVYGTRRGPKVKSTNGEEEQLMSSPKRTRIENPIPTMPSMPAVPQAHPGMPMMPLSLMAQNPEMHQNAFQLMLQQAFLMQTFQNLRMMNQGSGFVNPLSPINKPTETKEECQSNEEDSVLDLSHNKDSNKEVAEKRDYKMETPSTTDDEDDERMKLLYNVKVEHDVDDTPAEQPNSPTPSAESMPPAVESLRCPHCCITFDDIALFTIHMRFHNFMDPFTCNSCGQKCENKIEFTVHIFSRPH